MTIAEWLQSARQQLSDARISSAQLDAELLMAHVLKQSRTWLLAHSETTVDPHKKTQAQDYLTRRIHHEPLAYITGYKEFYGRLFSVSPQVLIPRPESEVVITLIKDVPDVQQAVVYDIGTGSGSLGLTVALEFPAVQQIILSDISAGALKVADHNRQRLAPDDSRIHLAQADLLPSSIVPQATIIANLPYVDTSWTRSPETAYEPQIALFAEDNGLALIIQLLDQAAHTLSSGYLILESDPCQHQAITKHATHLGFSLVSTHGFIQMFKWWL